MVKSPLTNSSNVVLVEEISTQYLIENYQKSFQIDVKRFFSNIEKVQIYKCLDTQYEFYYPLGNIEGDGKFYEDFQNFEWYYMDWKWEHEVASTLIGKNDKILEIGSGKGSFVEKMQKKGHKITGLELNQDAVQKCQDRNLTVIEQTVQQHTQTYKENYDLVCSFQVLEHISDVKGVLEASILALKKGGRLLISVPNNQSFIRIIKDNLLNMPPHHVGLWDKNSLSALPNIFPVELEKIYYEPLQKYHYMWYKNFIYQKFLEKKFKNSYWRFRLLLANSIEKFAPFFIEKFANRIHGHTIMASYIKK